jgi:sulfate adenylyltransferase
MAPGTEPHLIAPHGGVLTPTLAEGGERDALRERAAGLERVTLDERALCDLDMLASGAMSPLTGFMGPDDFASVVDDMRLANGLAWSLPITLAAPRPGTDEVALADDSGRLLAVMEIEHVYAYDKRHQAQSVYRTTEGAHPGVAAVYAQADTLLGGAIRVFDRPAPEFPVYALDPADTRKAFAERGWSRVVGFQTRNPMHRGHEYLTKCALETVDGLLVHPLVGSTKAGDLPPGVRMHCYEVLLDKYYPSAHTMLGVFPAAMRYAGPREAIFHALCRKNYGCSHFIVGRDHAGVGDYYGTYDAQTIFDEFAPHELDIEPMMFERTFWCRGVDGMASEKTTPFGPDQRVVLSGTAVREMLARGERPPAEFSRPEIADVLIEWARSQGR